MALILVALVAVALLAQARGGPEHGGAGPGPDRSGAGSTVAPPDVDDPRTSIDLAAAPDGSDPVAVARWWAATYTANVGAELPEALAGRLAGATAASLAADLAATPPAASYDPEPAPIEGVSSREPVTRDGQVQVRVTVETAGALTVYDLTLVLAGDGAAGQAARWLVDQASRL